MNECVVCYQEIPADRMMCEACEADMKPSKPEKPVDVKPEDAEKIFRERQGRAMTVE